MENESKWEITSFNKMTKSRFAPKMTKRWFCSGFVNMFNALVSILNVGPVGQNAQLAFALHCIPMTLKMR